MKNRLISFLLNPYFIAFAMALAVNLALPNYFSKYKVTLKDQYSFQRKAERVYFEDLNNDNISEKIFCFENVDKQASLNIFKPNGDLIDQWNCLSEFPKITKTLWFFDANNNGFKEIYFITIKQDSAFLNIVEPLAKEGIDKKNVFVDIIAPHNKEYQITPSREADLLISKDKQEIVFSLQSGFSGSPRNVYKYNLKENKIYKSPHLTNNPIVNQIIDLNADGLKEIVLDGYSSGNKIDTIYTKRTDNSSWLNVLDSNLNFIFEPIEFKNIFSGLHTIAFKNGKINQILCLINSRQTSVLPTKLFLFSNKGVKLKEKALPLLGQGNTLFLNADKKKIILFNYLNGNVIELNYNLDELNSFYLKPNAFMYRVDIDGDGKKEWLSRSNDNTNITIYRHNFNDPVSFNIPLKGLDVLYYGLKKISKTENELYFQKGNTYFIYGYTKNPYYMFKYIFFLGIYLGALGLVFLILKGYDLREARKKAIEKQIAQLQIKTIKNQVDSHFVFNAINTISEMKLTDDNLAADDFICKFSDFMRKTLQQSDSVSNTLEEEIDYIENYLQLQIIRFNNKFNYQINIEKGVSTKSLVPKHVLFTYVENAVKHALSNKPNGLLNIAISKKNKGLLLSIADNGGGLNTAHNTKRNSTGNGLLIMEKIYALYTQLYKQNVSHQLTEVLDADKSIKGLKIEVFISKKA